MLKMLFLLFMFNFPDFLIRKFLKPKLDSISGNLTIFSDPEMKISIKNSFRIKNYVT